VVTDGTGELITLRGQPMSEANPTVPLPDQSTMSSTAVISDSPYHQALARRRSARPLRILIALALVAALVVVVLVVLLPSAGPPGIRVPDLLGTQANAAVAKLARAGLHVHRDSVDGSQPAGLVESQRPTAGKHVPKGSTVDLRISSGFVILDASRFAGELYGQAAPALSAMGLVPVKIDVVSPNTVGSVLSISPVGRVKLGTPISVRVATSAPPPPAPPPGKNGPGHGHGKGHGH
jgi:hypothetical protein